MTISVGELFSKNGLEPAGVVPWDTPVPETGPGVYVVASTPDLDDSAGRVPTYSPDRNAFLALRELCPNTLIDGNTANDEELIARIGAFWIPQTPVLYVGLAGTSIQRRVKQYYSTAIGKRSPHAGGWWLKTMAELEELYVHFAVANDPDAAEAKLLSTFAAAVPASVRMTLHDKDRIAPFANIDAKRGIRKRHGLTGAKVPRTPNDTILRPPAAQDVRLIKPAASTRDGNELVEEGGVRIESQVISEKDRTKSYLRIPSRSKFALPPTDGYLSVVVQFERLQAPWRVNGSRSGTIGVGKNIMRTIGSANQGIWLRVHSDSVLVED